MAVFAIGNEGEMLYRDELGEIEIVRGIKSVRGKPNVQLAMRLIDLVVNASVGKTRLKQKHFQYEKVQEIACKG